MEVQFSKKCFSSSFFVEVQFSGPNDGGTIFERENYKKLTSTKKNTVDLLSYITKFTYAKQYAYFFHAEMQVFIVNMRAYTLTVPRPR
jgi:hypothetical protein